MKFKEFLSDLGEKYVNNKKEHGFMAAGYMPLNDWMFRDQEQEITAFRTVNYKGLSNIVKHQHQKKQKPAFTKGSVGIANGAIMPANYLVELKGKTALHLPLDASTALDRNGKRWLRPNDIITVRNDFSIPMLNKIDSEFLKVKRKDKNPFIANTQRLNEIDELSPKRKKEFIKWYYKEAKKMITPKLMEKIKEEIKEQYPGEYDNDEVLIHDYELINTWGVIDEYTDERLPEEFVKQNELEMKYLVASYESMTKFVYAEYKKEYYDFRKEFIKKYKYCNDIERDFIAKIDISKNIVPKCR
jgi:hypothetical protein